MSVPGLTRAWTNRRGAWTFTGLVCLLVALYLALWIAYAANGLRAYGRYLQLPPGASGTVRGADFRLLALTQTPVLTSATGAAPQSSAPNTVWVVASLEVVARQSTKDLFCTGALVGPDRRRWPVSSAGPVRVHPTYCDIGKFRIGEPYRWEPVFEIPTRFVDQLFGFALIEDTNPAPTQVLRPPVS